MRKYYALFCLLFLRLAGFPQGNDFRLSFSNVNYSAGLTNASGYCLYGRSGSDLVLTRTDWAVNTVWSKKYPVPGLNYCRGFRQLSDRGFLLCANLNDNTSNASLQLLRIDSSGNLLWSKIYRVGNYVQGAGFTVLANGSLILYGSRMAGNYIFPFIFKTDSTGNVLWQRSFLSPFTPPLEMLGEVREFPGGDLLVSASPQGPFLGSVLFRTDSTATVFRWCRHLPCNAPAPGGTIISGNEIIIASSLPDPNFSSDVDGLIVKTDTSGNVFFVKEFMENYTGSFSCIQPTGSNGFILSGTSLNFTSPPTPDGFIMKTDTAFNITWVKRTGKPGINCIDYSGFVIQAPDKGMLNNNNGPYLNGCELIKTDSVGNSTCFDSTVTYSTSLLSYTSTPNMQLSNDTFTTLVTIPVLSASAFSPAFSMECFTGDPEKEKVFSAEVFPNPSDGRIRVRTGLEKFTLEIRDLAGRIVFTEKDAHRECYADLSAVSKGIYLLVISNSSLIRTQKIVIE